VACGFGRELLDRRIVVRFQAGMPKPNGRDHEGDDQNKNGQCPAVEMWHVLSPPGVRGRVVRGSHTLPSIADLTLDGSR
jgi:hypothetical protein